jgi:hypothetical protein
MLLCIQEERTLKKFSEDTVFMNTPNIPIYEIYTRAQLTEQSQRLAEHADINVYEIFSLAEEVKTAEKESFSIDVSQVKKNAKRFASYAIMCFEMTTHGIVAFPEIDVPILHAKEGGDVAVPLHTMNVASRGGNDTRESLYRDGIKAMELYIELVEREKTLQKQSEVVQKMLKRKKILRDAFALIKKEPAEEKRWAMIRAITHHVF